MWVQRSVTYTCTWHPTPVCECRGQWLIHTHDTQPLYVSAEVSDLYIHMTPNPCMWVQRSVTYTYTWHTTPVCECRGQWLIHTLDTLPLYVSAEVRDLYIHMTPNPCMWVQRSVTYTCTWHPTPVCECRGQWLIHALDTQPLYVSAEVSDLYMHLTPNPCMWLQRSVTYTYTWHPTPVCECRGQWLIYTLDTQPLYVSAEVSDLYMHLTPNPCMWVQRSVTYTYTWHPSPVCECRGQSYIYRIG